VEGVKSCLARTGIGGRPHRLCLNAGHSDQRLARVNMLPFVHKHRFDLSGNSSADRMRLLRLNDEISVLAVSPQRSKQQHAESYRSNRKRRLAMEVCAFEVSPT